MFITKRRMRRIAERLLDEAHDLNLISKGDVPLEAAIKLGAAKALIKASCIIMEEAK